MKVKDIYRGIADVGEWIGSPCTYITIPHIYTDIFVEITIAQILYKVESVGMKKVVILWGNNPSTVNDVNELVCKLIIRGYDVNVETDGKMPLNEILKLRVQNPLSTLIITLNITLFNDSEKSQTFLTKTLTFLDSRDSIIFNIKNSSDLYTMELIIKDTINTFLKLNKMKIFVVPFDYRTSQKNIVLFLVEHKLHEVKFQQPLNIADN